MIFGNPFAAAANRRYNASPQLEPQHSGGISSMKCNQCGAESPANATFCPQCGVQLSAARRRRKPTCSGASSLQAARPGNQPVRRRSCGLAAYSPKAMIGSFVGAALLTIVGMVVADLTLPGGVGLDRRWSSAAFVMWACCCCSVALSPLDGTLPLDDAPLVSRNGHFESHSTIASRSSISTTSRCQQGFIERMFNIGTIHSFK